jgi:hypothetical protein
MSVFNGDTYEMFDDGPTFFPDSSWSWWLSDVICPLWGPSSRLHIDILHRSPASQSLVML